MNQKITMDRMTAIRSSTGNRILNYLKMDVLVLMKKKIKSSKPLLIIGAGLIIIISTIVCWNMFGDKPQTTQAPQATAVEIQMVENDGFVIGFIL